jgi:hypothetical protein
MSLQKFFFILLSVALLGACAGNADSEKSSDEATDQTDNTMIQTTDQNAGTSGMATSTAHYICPNNCEGSGGPAAGTCPVCGSEYVHNSAFHQQQATQGSSQQPIELGDIQTQPQNQNTPPPAQNTEGEFHFVCSKACGGGGATAGNCPNCGAPLEHNQAYHQ